MEQLPGLFVAGPPAAEARVGGPVAGQRVKSGGGGAKESPLKGEHAKSENRPVCRV